MKTEFLKELGLESNMIAKIMVENGKDIEREKAKVSGLSEKIKSANEKIDKYEKAIKGLQSYEKKAAKYKNILFKEAYKPKNVN